jgi:hypothetical protein
MRPSNHQLHSTVPSEDLEPTMSPIGTFAAGQSRVGEYHVAVEAPVGTFASGLTTETDERRETA